MSRTNQDPTPASFVVLLSVAAVSAVGVLVRTLLRDQRPLMITGSPVEPPRVPTEFEAALAAVRELPVASLDEQVSRALAISHPECPIDLAGATAECVEASNRLAQIIQLLLLPPEPVTVQGPPNQCDPLTYNVPGFVCVPAGTWFVALPEAQQEQIPPTPGPDQVLFSADYDRFRRGSSWDIVVLDTFLEQLRQQGELVTTGTLILPLEALLAVLDAGGLPEDRWEALGWPGARVAYLDELGPLPGTGVQTVVELSAVEAIRQFAASTFVQVVDNQPVRILDLPETPAVDTFRETVVRAVARFQKRTFEE